MDDQTLHHRHPLRFVIVLLFLAVLLATTGKAGQDISYQPPVSTDEQSADALPPLSVAQAAADPAPVGVPADDPFLMPNGPVAPSNAVASIATPATVRGVYLTSWSAGNQKTVARIENLAATTEINAVVIDIKDATGRISYHPDDPALVASGAGTGRIKDLSALTDELHQQGIYVIGRVQVFEDPYYAALHPEDAFLDTRTNGPWRDYKGIMWLRPNAPAVWDYIVAIARDAHAHGVDEINLDYVRFPSDGELQFLDKSTLTQTRADTLAAFFSYIGDALHQSGIVVSADIFGLTMSASDDLGIGQTVEAIAPHVDYVCPMVYPSHFAAGVYGIMAPAEHPYDIIHTSLADGIKKLAAIGESPDKLRPWLQDFNLGAVYTSDMVRAQIDAAAADGINSWTLWDPRNQYTETALLPESQP